MRLFSLILFVQLLSVRAVAQEPVTLPAADSSSYALYQQGQWKELIHYGKALTGQGIDFPLLRMRMGYAAYMTGDYSGAIAHYEKVLKADSYNSIAHYFIYWSRINLGQPEQARASLRYITAPDIPAGQFKNGGIESAGIELSSKTNSITDRGAAMYWRAAAGYRFSQAVHMETALAGYQQQLNEPGLTDVTNNNKVQINQVELYNKLTANLNRQWQLKLAWHYLRTPFNNFSYNNHLFMAGLNYNATYAAVQADVILGRLTDTSSTQLDLQLRLYPLGNMKLYSFSTGTVLDREQTSFIFRQVLGVQVLKPLWLEGHITTGPFRNLAENDALYLYNAIDADRLKAGGTLYVQVKKAVIQLGYTLEQKERYIQGTIFQQHSITGGIKWTF